MAKLTRKERAAQQKAQHAAATSSPQPVKKKSSVPTTKANSLVRGLTVVLIIVSVVVYFNSLFSEYALDDYSLILENVQTKQGYKAVPDIFKSAYRAGYLTGDNSLYRPLSKAMFAIEWSMTEGPGINHFMNVVLFTLSIVLLFKMLRLYMRDGILIPFLTAVLFAVHPIHTEVVANIKGRDDILCFLLFVTTAIQVYRYYSTQQNKHLVFAAIAFFFCFMSKESALTFVAVIPLMLYFFTDADKRTHLMVGAKLLGVTLLFLLIRFAVLGSSGPSVVPVVDNYIAGIDGFMDQRATAVAIAGVYLLKLIVPHNLVCDASVAEFPAYTIGSWQVLLPLVLFLGAFAFAVMKFRSKHPLSFAILYFFITFSMVSNIVFLIGTNYGERLLYAPSLGICLIAAWLIAKFIQREEGPAVNVGDFFRANNKAVITVGAIACVFAVIAIMRNTVWTSNDTLYANDVQISTRSAKLHYYHANHITLKENLAEYQPGSAERAKIIDSAMNEFREALTYYPGYSDAMQKLAEMFFEKQQYDSADRYYRMAIERIPTNAIYRNNYGRMLFSTGRLIEAQSQFEAAIRFNPGYSTAYNNLAGAIGTQGGNYVRMAQQDPAKQSEYSQKAIEQFQKSVQLSLRSIELDPLFISAYETTAMTYQNMGDPVNAQKYQQMAQNLINSGRGHR